MIVCRQASDAERNGIMELVIRTFIRFEIDAVIQRNTCVKMGHPMLDAHYIEWILLETKEGRQRKTLKSGEKSVAVFSLADGDEVIAAYEYYNLHGLWKATV